MSTFSVPVVKVTNVAPIEGADLIEVAEVLGYRCVVKKGDFKVGDLAVYIPEDSIVPMWIQTELNLVGKLAGSAKNRVKAVKLRGVISQGLLYPADKQTAEGSTISNVDQNERVMVEGDDVAEFFGVTKYAPTVPMHMTGEVCNMRGNTIRYDIENIQRYPNVLQPGEDVVYTEKIHGTFCGLAIVPGVSNRDLLNGHAFAFSKGLGGNGLVFKNNEKNASNIYYKTLLEHYNKLLNFLSNEKNPLFVLGEIYGKGIQDLTYGEDTPKFRVFDIYIGKPGFGRFLSYEEMVAKCYCQFECVPVLYRGPYSKETEVKFRSGIDAVSGNNIREGIVIRPVVERSDYSIGRVILKSVSPEYLLRKGNVTEYQ